MSEFSARLVSLRGLAPRSATAAALGIKESTYATYERGAHEPSLATLLRIAKYFHVSLDYLVAGTGAESVSVTHNGDHSPVATQNASCAECPLARTVERQAALIERLSLAMKGEQ